VDFPDEPPTGDEYQTRASLDVPDAFKSQDHRLLYDTAPARRLIAKHQALHYPYSCTFGSAALEIWQGVFCPTLATPARLLLDTVTFSAGEHVLDVFSGSGAFGINAALTGATVVTVDISPLAVANTKRNAELNQAAGRVDARLGTLEECISAGETFDLVIANPPLLPGEQTGELSTSIFDPGLRSTTGFIRTIGPHLAASGRCYLVTSDVMERCGYDVDQLCFESGLNSYIAKKLDVGYESYTVHEIVKARIKEQ
jgi:SAM-dependent methyltransferase